MGCGSSVLTLRTREDNLARDEDEEHDLGLHHAVDQTGEQLWFVRREHVMSAGQLREGSLVTK